MKNINRDIERERYKDKQGEGDVEKSQRKQLKFGRNNAKWTVRKRDSKKELDRKRKTERKKQTEREIQKERRKHKETE